jgi:hypothetical protein
LVFTEKAMLLEGRINGKTTPVYLHCAKMAKDFETKIELNKPPVPTFWQKIAPTTPLKLGVYIVGISTVAVGVILFKKRNN